MAPCHGSKYSQEYLKRFGPQRSPVSDQLLEQAVERAFDFGRVPRKVGEVRRLEQERHRVLLDASPGLSAGGLKDAAI
jgi:hypothetical protein